MLIRGYVFDELPRIAARVRAVFNADIHPALGQLILDMEEAYDRLNVPAHEDQEPLPPLVDLAEQFGRASAAAVLSGDLSFFDQVTHAITYPATESGARAIETNLETRRAHIWACLLKASSKDYEAPHATEVARVLDVIKGKPQGTTTAAEIVDRTKRVALQLPLAPKGKRGPKKESREK